ncbi:ABC transporter permease [Dactylosporangium roseum]|uniref:ABC transporter permease n=1 Tax=Dactylosporangium roseum TaxID=47989 RepID=A0ABY5ZAK0_9ACTN|nr:ABC transporter permease [Dactylosporangium roseum]UWZ39098.1 ABC transporter permease [Dactylosporangium roseum]
MVFLLIATAGQFVGDPYRLVTMGPEAPSWQHWFGTDNLGRDVFARTASGAGTSLLISVGAILLGLILAFPLGLLAGYHQGRRVDGAIMRTLEGVQALPMLVFVMFMLSLMSTTPVHLGPVTLGMEAKLILGIGLGFVPFFARVARAATLVEMQEDYVAGLRVVGVRPRTILLSEISVNVLPPVLVQACLATAIAIFAEGGLSFLGLGVAPPKPTLGNIIGQSGSQIIEGMWWYAALPGLVMVVGILGFNLLGDALTESALGPRVGEERE